MWAFWKINRRRPNKKAEIEALKAELKAKDEKLIEAELKANKKDSGIEALKAELKAKDEKVSGEYWDTFEDVWTFKDAEYTGCFKTALEYRRNNHCNLYYEDVVEILGNDNTIETVLQDENAPSVFETNDETTVRSFVTTGSDLYDSNNRLNRRGDKSHEKDHAKNFLGQEIGKNSKSRAHTFPKDEVCNRWWWPMYQLVTGSQQEDYNQSSIEKLASMRTCKFVFGGEHNHIYDSLKEGVVCTIPIFESMEEMAGWQYGNGYKMLIVADSAESYWKLHMAQDSLYDHIQMASREEVEKATKILAEMMTVMADSLVSNWKVHYETLPEQEKRKEMLTRMKNILETDSGIYIPVIRDRDGQDPKLYTIDYSVLYKDNPEGEKYIIDPLPAAIKSGMNLSFFTTAQRHPDKKGCKLLPGCLGSLSSSEEEESVRSVDILDLLDREEEKRAPTTSFQELVGKEIELRVVSDDEFDEDDDITVLSELGN